jgi:glycosyltransferase involved in cell wall biosynthesis
VRIFGWSNAQGGVHHYRIREPLRGLALRGHETRSLPAAMLDVFEQYDVVLVRGLHHPRNSMLWRYAAESGKHALRVYDLDDDIWAWNPGSEEDRYWTNERRLNVELNIQCADLVTTPTTAMADVLSALNPRVAVLPNTIPKQLLQWLPPKRDRFVIGWQGAQQHVKDLELIYNPILRFMLRYPDVEFHLWGPGKIMDFPDALAERIFCYAWTNRVWDHYTRLSMDVGLAPLDKRDRFNETKSDIKLREYAALGIPYIASRCEAYTSTATSTRGLVANGESEWEAALVELYRNASLRQWIAEQGRVRARLWTTEENGKEWEQAYERARHARRLRESAAGNGSAAPRESRATFTDSGRPIVNVRTSRT